MTPEELYGRLAASQAPYVLNPDKSWALEVLRGLLINERRYGYPSCPGRLAFGLAEKDGPIICPCAFRREDVVKYGRCYCHLYFGREAAPSLTAVPDRWLR